LLLHGERKIETLKHLQLAKPTTALDREQNKQKLQQGEAQKNHLKKWFGARNRNRTCTSLRTADFESAASTNSAIRADERKLNMTRRRRDIHLIFGLQYYTFR
jgi:hypothetical protein